MSVDGKRVDAVEAAGVIGYQELLTRPPWSPARRCTRRQAQVDQDLPCHAFVLDQCDESHGAGTLRADEHVDG